MMFKWEINTRGLNVGVEWLTAIRDLEAAFRQRSSLGERLPPGVNSWDYTS